MLDSKCLATKEFARRSLGFECANRLVPVHQAFSSQKVGRCWNMLAPFHLGMSWKKSMKNRKSPPVSPWHRPSARGPTMALRGQTLQWHPRPSGRRLWRSGHSDDRWAAANLPASTLAMIWLQRWSHRKSSKVIERFEFSKAAWDLPIQNLKRYEERDAEAHWSAPMIDGKGMVIVGRSDGSMYKAHISKTSWFFAMFCAILVNKNGNDPDRHRQVYGPERSFKGVRSRAAGSWLTLMSQRENTALTNA